MAPWTTDPIVLALFGTGIVLGTALVVIPGPLSTTRLAEAPWRGAAKLPASMRYRARRRVRAIGAGGLAGLLGCAVGLAWWGDVSPRDAISAFLVAGTLTAAIARLGVVLTERVPVPDGPRVAQPRARRVRDHLPARIHWGMRCLVASVVPAAAGLYLARPSSRGLAVMLLTAAGAVVVLALLEALLRVVVARPVPVADQLGLDAAAVIRSWDCLDACWAALIGWIPLFNGVLFLLSPQDAGGVTADLIAVSVLGLTGFGLLGVWLSSAGRGLERLFAGSAAAGSA